ncbi:MAG: hypothetical protein HUU02_12125 [Bacteroidetes bacterium]|nr:hypothetical protein [Bacteroidota bacterium]
MNCSEFRECVCEIVDRRLPEERTSELMQHAAVCPHCSFEYRSMQATKQAVHDKLKRESVPADVYYSIINATLNRSGSSWFRKLFGFRLNPVIAVVMVAFIGVGIYSLVTPDAPGAADEANILSQSLKNYQAVIGGAIKPQLVSSEEDVRSFLAKEVPFDVIVPKMKDCNSCAGVLSSFNGIKLAHVVYQVGTKGTLYIYQADMNEAMQGTALMLPEDAKSDLQKTGWYVREEPNGVTVVMWQVNNTLCSAVSTMKKDEMIALLSENSGR